MDSFACQSSPACLSVQSCLLVQGCILFRCPPCRPPLRRPLIEDLGTILHGWHVQRFVRAKLSHRYDQRRVDALNLNDRKRTLFRAAIAQHCDPASHGQIGTDLFEHFHCVGTNDIADCKRCSRALSNVCTHNEHSQIRTSCFLTSTQRFNCTRCAKGKINLNMLVIAFLRRWGVYFAAVDDLEPTVPNRTWKNSAHKLRTTCSWS